MKTKTEIIKELACREFGVMPEEYDSDDRDQDIIKARYAAWYCAKSLRTMTHKQIADGLGAGRDRSTLTRAIDKTIPNMMQTDHVFARKVKRIEEILMLPVFDLPNQLRLLSDRWQTMRDEDITRQLLSIANRVEDVLRCV